MSLWVAIVVADRCGHVAWRQGELGARHSPRVDRARGPGGRPFGEVADENHLRRFVACVLSKRMKQDVASKKRGVGCSSDVLKRKDSCSRRWGEVVWRKKVREVARRVKQCSSQSRRRTVIAVSLFGEITC